MKEKTEKYYQWKKNLVGTDESAKAVIRRFSVNMVFWKTVQNSQENTCAGGVSF